MSTLKKLALIFHMVSQNRGLRSFLVQRMSSSPWAAVTRVLCITGSIMRIGSLTTLRVSLLTRFV